MLNDLVISKHTTEKHFLKSKRNKKEKYYRKSEKVVLSAHNKLYDNLFSIRK